MMKRVDLIRHIEASGCAFLREGGRHTVYVNPTARRRKGDAALFLAVTDFASAPRVEAGPNACRVDFGYNWTSEDQTMSDSAVELIQTFSALPRSEQYAVFLELAKISEANAGPVADEELIAAGEAIFAMYDAEEAVRGVAEAG